MQTRHAAVGISTLLSTLALEANRARTFIDHQALPYQMPTLEASFKLALSALQGESSGLAQLKVATIAPGQAHVPVSSVSTKLIACPARQAAPVQWQVLSQALSVVGKGAQLRIEVAVSGASAVAVNLDRRLAQQLNHQPLSVETRVPIPLLIPDEQGRFIIDIDVAAADRGAFKLPVNFSALHRQKTFIFTTLA